MTASRPSLRRLARGSAALAALAGGYGVLDMMGAFGPVSCWRGVGANGSASSNGTVTATAPTVTGGCESGIDALLEPGGGNAGVLFSWSLVLFALVAVGSYSSVWNR